MRRAYGTKPAGLPQGQDRTFQPMCWNVTGRLPMCRMRGSKMHGRSSTGIPSGGGNSTSLPGSWSTWTPRWRHKHVVTVERMIGGKRGTGGTVRGFPICNRHWLAVWRLAGSWIGLSLLPAYETLNGLLRSSGACGHSFDPTPSSEYDARAG